MMQELEKILEEIERYVKVYQTPPLGIEVEGTVELLESCRDIIRKHMSGKDTDVPANDGWISVEDRLPEEKVNPISRDYYEYQVTAKFGNTKDVRYYRYGNGHWWNGPGIVDKYVIAWRGNPEPYSQEQPETCKYTDGSCCWPIEQCGECPNHPERSEEE